jgi:hypothetical protein
MLLPDIMNEQFEMQKYLMLNFKQENVYFLMGINTYNVYPTTQDLSCNSDSNGDQNKTLLKLLLQL